MFQTNLRGVEALCKYTDRHPVASFQTNLRGVEADSDAKATPEVQPFQTNLRGVEASSYLSDTMLSFVSDEPSWG